MNERIEYTWTFNILVWFRFILKSYEVFPYISYQSPIRRKPRQFYAPTAIKPKHFLWKLNVNKIINVKSRIEEDFSIIFPLFFVWEKSWYEKLKTNLLVNWETQCFYQHIILIWFFYFLFLLNTALFMFARKKRAFSKIIFKNNSDK
jgi:hypothetical protein